MDSFSEPKKARRVGDIVVYTGDQPALRTSFKDGGLPIKEIKNGYAYCVRADGYFTT